MINMELQQPREEVFHPALVQHPVTDKGIGRSENEAGHQREIIVQVDRQAQKGHEDQCHDDPFQQGNPDIPRMPVMVLVPLKGQRIRFVFLIVRVKAVHVVFYIGGTEKPVEEQDAEENHRVCLNKCRKGGDAGKYHQEYAGAIHRTIGVRQLQED